MVADLQLPSNRRVHLPIELEADGRATIRFVPEEEGKNKSTRLNISCLSAELVWSVCLRGAKQKGNCLACLKKTDTKVISELAREFNEFKPSFFD